MLLIVALLEGGFVKPLLRTLAIVAFLILASQTVRHAYILWLEPRGSVLDKYDRPLKDEISSAGSLEELLQRYDRVRKEVDTAKQEASKSGKEISFQTQNELEPFKSERALQEAIREWENRANEIRALRFYWFIGFLFCAMGSITYWKANRWLGITLEIIGFCEFIYWTSPTFLGAGTREFDRLLVNKFLFSVVSFLLLIGLIWLQRIFVQEETS